MAFNPDEFLAEETITESSTGGFDPDAFLSGGEPEQEVAVVEEVAPAQEFTAVSSVDSNPAIVNLRRIIAENEGNPDVQRALGESLQREIERATKMDELKASNPALASNIEEMPKWERSAVNVGRGMHDVYRGAKNLFGGNEQEQQTEALDALEAQTPGGEGARMIGQMAPFAPAGVASTAIKSTLPRIAAQSALGSAEGYTSQEGMGNDGTTGAVIGAVAPAAIAVTPKVAKAIYSPFAEFARNRASVKNILGSAAPNDVVDAAESIAKQGGDDAGAQINALMLTDDAVTSAHPTVRKIKEAVDAGATPDDVKAVIAAQKDVATKGEAARYKLAGERVKKSPVAQEMIRQGMSKNDVQLIAAASEADKEVFKKILSRVKGGMASSRVKNREHPQGVVGDSLLKRLEYVSAKNKEAGQRIKQVAQSELKGKPVSLNGPLENFKAKLDDMGVKFNDGKVDFEGSALMDLPKFQTPIRNILKRIDPERNPNVDAYAAHNLKKWFDSNINYGKSPTGAGMTPEVESAIRGFRADINETLGNLSPKYKAVNTQYADTIGAINDLKSLAGKRRDLAGDHADETLGMLSKRVTSNAMSRGDVSSAIEALEDVSAKYGKVFKDDIATQVQLVNAIEKKLGAFSDTSLMGQVQAPMERLATGGSVVSTGLDALKAVKNKLSPKDEESYIKALEALINGK